MVDQNLKHENVIFQGKIFQIIQKSIHEKTFEIASRSPGVRLLIIDGDNILLTKEYRHEYQGYDYRLPWGKVFDTLTEFNKKLINNKYILPYAEIAAKKECKEETWIIPKKLKHFHTSKAGTTVERDLYYFIVESFEHNKKGQELEEGEDITIERKTKEEVKKLCIHGEMNEERSVAVLLRFLLQ